MNRDLEETLNELGPDYRAVVARLRAGREAASGSRSSSDSRSSSRAAYLVAASLLVLIGLTVVHLSQSQSQSQTTNHKPQTPSCPREYRATVAEMIATQNPDGSWQNDFLTRRNAAALKDSDNLAAQIAYKKAMRNLRARGVL